MASKGQKWDWRQASLCPELSHPRTRLPTQPPASSPLSLHSLLTAPCCPGMGTAPPCQMSPPTTGGRTSSLSLPFRWFREAGTSLTAHTSGSPRTASERRTRAAKRRSVWCTEEKAFFTRETTQMAGPFIVSALRAATKPWAIYRSAAFLLFPVRKLH